MVETEKPLHRRSEPDTDHVGDVRGKLGTCGLGSKGKTAERRDMRAHTREMGFTSGRGAHRERTGGAGTAVEGNASRKHGRAEGNDGEGFPDAGLMGEDESLET